MTDQTSTTKWTDKFLVFYAKPTPESQKEFQALYDQNFKEGIHRDFDFRVTDMGITDQLRDFGLECHANDSFLRGLGFPVQGQPLATSAEVQPQKQGQEAETEAKEAPEFNSSLLSQIAGANLKEASLRYDETKKRKFKDGYEAIFNYIKRNGTCYPDKNAPGDYLFYRHNAKGKRVVIRQDWNDTTWLTEYTKDDEWKNRVTFSLENTPEHVNNLWQMFNALTSI